MSGHARLVIGAVLAAAALAPTACGSDGGPAMEKLFETEHFVYYRQPGAAASCPGVGNWLERYYRAFEDFFGVSRPSGNKLTYRLYANTNDSLAACSGSGRNCYVPGSQTIVSVEPLKPHEIVHVFERLVGTPKPAPGMFSEGVATLLGGTVGPPRADGRLDTSLDLENLLDSEAFYQRTDDVGGDVTYSAAAGFMRFLLDRYGRDAFLAIYGSLDDAADGAEVESRFATSAGEALRDVIAAWRTALPPPYDEVVFQSPVCGQLPAVVPGGSVVLDPGCAFEGVRFDVPSSGRLDVLFQRLPDQSADKLAFAHLYRCEGGAPLDAGVFVRGDLRLALDVAPGTYMALVDGASVSLSIPTEPVTLDVDDTCSAGRTAAPLGGPDSATLVIVRRWTNAETHVAFDVDIAAAGQLRLGSISLELLMPNDLYACPQACLSDPDQACAHDQLPGIQMGDTPRVLGMNVAAGDALHLETGTRSQPSWQYSLQLSVDPAAP